MENPAAEKLKGEVRDFWNQRSCDTHIALAAKFTRDYFEEIESFRYKDQPFIHSFAQFTRYRDKKVLEVGFGAGTDFIQWLRAGAKATGIDLTQEGLDNLTHRIGVYNLPKPEQTRLADAENLPFADNTFDLGYSFGVLHHSPNTEKAIAELVRAVRPGGEIKIMLYNIRSIYAYNFWFKFCLLKGKPWKGPRWALWHHMESIGTKAYTRAELSKILGALPLRNMRVTTEMTGADYFSASAFKPLNWFFRACLYLAGYRPNWRLSDHQPKEDRLREPDSGKVEFYGNPLGFFHCIAAVKKGGPGDR